MAGNLPDAVKKCVAILKVASNDTEKFAALFMVTKLVKGETCSTDSKKALFEAIGFTFLKRLLLSPDVPADCPPQVYKSVAMSVLSAFCSEPELATHPEMLANIPVFLDIVQLADDDDDDNLMVVSETYKCLLSIAAYPSGQNALYEIGAVSKMSEIYSQQSFQTDEALNILIALACRFGPDVWEKDNPKPFHALLNKIALDFETDHSERKFELCEIIYTLLFNCQKKIVSATANEESWPGSVYKGLNDILTSKLGKAQRDPALKLASVIVDVLGVEWCLTDEEKPKQFFLLLVQLCSVEVRMQLEDRSFKQILENAELVSSCFIFLELAVSYIATDTLDLEQKEKQQLYTALKGGFAAVINVLLKLSKDTKNNKDSLDVKSKIFVCAMIRVLAAWLSQETSAMRNAVYQILPFILIFANDTFYAYRARYVTDKVRSESKSGPNQSTLLSNTDSDPLSHIDVLRLLLPALCHLAVEETSRKIMMDVKEDEVLHECLAFHWSIVHYKKPPVPKSERLKVKTQPEPELPAKLLEDMKDSRAAMISICNIFMNITVLESKLVEESSLFASLLKFIFNNLPELKNIPENLVLHGNLAILGLLLLKQLSKRVKKNDFSICRYIQATIRFLWDAYNVDESNDSSSLVVALAYKENWRELMELWFLGMQTMSSVLVAIPWISEFAIESGWAEGIVTTLNKVRVGQLPANTKSAYEDFLCNLVEANNSVTQVLKENDALSMCRKHRFMELGKKLFGD
ncbi:neurochondrin [Lycorma delicatula]|uniref:neurochondrin n=1 Tax=Lycorma delicatula TaxID=130591 RepID=UPI003F5150CD